MKGSEYYILCIYRDCLAQLHPLECQHKHVMKHSHKIYVYTLLSHKIINHNCNIIYQDSNPDTYVHLRRKLLCINKLCIYIHVFFITWHYNIYVYLFLSKVYVHNDKLYTYICAIVCIYIYTHNADRDDGDYRHP